MCNIYFCTCKNAYLITLSFSEATSKSVPSTLENIADAVIHAKFVSLDENSDGVVLMKVLQVFRTLVLSPIGPMLTNESMCDIMLYCFRICFDHHLTGKYFFN